MKKINVFGGLLRAARIRAGYGTLESAIIALNDSTSLSGSLVSKSALSMYERGEIQFIKPEVLNALADLYGASYEELARAWFEEQFSVQVKQRQGASFVKAQYENLCLFKGKTDDSRDDIKIITIEELERVQSELPAKAQVGVAAIDFLDENLLFDMVSRNIQRGVRYYYLMPESNYTTYLTFVSKIEKRYPKLRGKVDQQRSFFFPRSNLEFPINYVLYCYPDNRIEACVGVLHGTEVCYYQSADLKLAVRLYDGFKWSVSVSFNSTLRKMLFELQNRFLTRYRVASRYNLDPL